MNRTAILTKPKNALIKQYKKLFEYEGIEFIVEDGAIDFIVEKALEYNLGARGLRSIVEAIVTDAMFDLPSQTEIKKFEVSEEYAREKLANSKISKLKVA